MPFSRPNLDDLRAQGAADLAAALPGADPLLPVSNLAILVDVLQAAVSGLYGYLDWIALQSVPFTATDESFEGWAALKGVTRKPATQATGQAVFPGSVGTLLPAGTPVSRGDGAAYLTTADATVAGGGTVTAPIQAIAAGAAATLATDAALVLGQSVSGIGSVGAAVAGVAGADVEADADFRTRVLAIYAEPPQGGAASDYVTWALEVSGVTRAWCKPNGQGLGTVVVYFMMDVSEAAHGGFPQGTNGVASAETRDTPAAGDQLAVADHIYALRPVTACVYACAPAKNTIALTISLPGASVAVKSAVQAAIDAALVKYGSPGGIVNLLRLYSAVAAIVDADGLVITAESCDHGSISPTNGNITSAAGYLPVRGVVTWA